MAILVGTGRGAEAGVLIRNAEALEAMERIDTLLLDKTGTLTEGKPRLTDYGALTGFDPIDVLRLAASLEQASEHPLASAIITAAQERTLHLSKPGISRTFPGEGVVGQADGLHVALGNAALFTRLKIAPGDLAQREGIWVAIGGKAAGWIQVADSLKPTTRAAIEALRAEGLQIVMVTGDRRSTAEAIAREVGITQIEAEVLPADKSAVVDRYNQQGRTVAMAGDGINDAPALAKAQVGIAMGNGTDIAMESAGITLVKGDLQGIVRARRLSRLVMRNIRQNLFFAFIYNLLGVPVAAGILYPVFGLLLSPMLAAAAMTFSSVSVISNSLRLRRVSL